MPDPSILQVFELGTIAALATGWLLENRRCQRMKIDPTYGVYTRVAAEASAKKSGAIIFWDIDHMHQLNEQWGYEKVDAKISTASKQLRISRDCRLIARWYSGDEFIYNCPEKDSAGAANRIKCLFNEQGLSVTVGVATITENNWREAVRVASGLVQAAKAAGHRGDVHYANATASVLTETAT